MSLTQVSFLGIPHLGMISLSSTFGTVAAYAFPVGKTSVHLENISTITKQYFFASHGDSSIKSIIKWSNGASGVGWQDCLTSSSIMSETHQAPRTKIL